MLSSLIDSGLLTRAAAAADRTARWDGASHGNLLKACDDFFVYNESGWACLVGYEIKRDEAGKEYSRRRILNVHFNSSDDRAGVLAGYNLATDGHSVYEMSAAEKRRQRAARWKGSDYRFPGDEDDDASE